MTTAPITPEALPDLETLALLVAIDVQGSIGAGARARGISQPAASARIREAEARWRLRLLERSPRGSRLTSEGRTVVAWSRRVLDEVQILTTGVASLRSDREATLRVAASLTVAEFLLPRWLGRLNARVPDLRPRMLVVNSAGVEELVRSGAADVGFVESTVVARDLLVRRVDTDELCVVVSPEDPWADRATPLSGADVLSRRWVLREPGSGTRRTFEDAVGGEPACALEAGSTAALLGAVVAGLGPGVVSRRAVQAAVEAGTVREVFTDLDLTRPVHAVLRPGRRHHGHVDTLVGIAAAVRRES